MAKDGVRIEWKLDSKAIRWFSTHAPNKLKLARKKAVEAAGMVWADETKSLTRSENHIVTGLYVNSIGYSTGAPSSPINELQEGATKTVLKTGAAVPYATALEKRYSLMARGLDIAESRMKSVAIEQIRRTLF